MRRRVLWLLVLAVVFAVPAAWVAAATAQTEYSFGPHQATYEVVLNGRLTVDMGPVGALVAPSPLPAPFDFAGLKITVGAIPEALEVPVDAQSLAASASQYSTFFTGMDAVVEAVARGLVTNALIRFGVIWGGSLVAVLLVTALMGRRRVGEVAHWCWRHRLLVAVAVIGVMAGGLAGEYWRVRQAVQSEGQRVASPIFAGTVLEGARVSGRLGQVLDDYGAKALELYRQTNDFYDRAAANAEAVLAAQQGSAQLHGSPEVLQSIGWLAGGGAFAGLRPVVVTSDLHCNIGMARVVGAVARGAGANLVLDAGDTTMDGTAVEAFCVDGLADAVGSEATIVAVGGNHDTATTASQQVAAGIEVLDGHVVQFDGLRLLGDADWASSKLGQGTSGGVESAEQLGQRLGQIACESPDQVDVLLVHNPWVARAGLKQGCLPLAISGHMHARSGPEPVGSGLIFVASSTGRDLKETTTLGPLGSNSEIPILLFNPEGHLVALQIVTVHPNANVTLGPIELAPPVAWFTPE